MYPSMRLLQSMTTFVPEGTPVFKHFSIPTTLTHATSSDTTGDMETKHDSTNATIAKIFQNVREIFDLFEVSQKFSEVWGRARTCFDLLKNSDAFGYVSMRSEAFGKCEPPPRPKSPKCALSQQKKPPASPVKVESCKFSKTRVTEVSRRSELSSRGRLTCEVRSRRAASTGFAKPNPLGLNLLRMLVCLNPFLREFSMSCIGRWYVAIPIYYTCLRL